MPSGANDNDLRIAISLSFESFARASTSGDIDAFLNQWTPDGIFWPPDGEELNGHQAIRAWTIQLGKTANLIVEPLHVERIGDFAFVVGDFTQDVTLQGSSCTSAAVSRVFSATRATAGRCTASSHSKSERRPRDTGRALIQT